MDVNQLFYVLNRAIISKSLIFSGFFIFLCNFYTNSRRFAPNFRRPAACTYFFLYFPELEVTGYTMVLQAQLVVFYKIFLKYIKTFVTIKLIFTN